jgi:hypothetical protein
LTGHLAPVDFRAADLSLSILRASRLDSFTSIDNCFQCFSLSSFLEDARAVANAFGQYLRRVLRFLLKLVLEALARENLPSHL